MVVEKRFYSPLRPVSIINIGDSGEALLIRAILENLGAVVTLHLPGTPSDFLLTLADSTSPEHVIICGHGDATGFHFGDYGKGIDVSMLRAGHLPPEAIARHIDLPGRIVVSTACKTGAPTMAAAFLNGGLAAYIAPDGYPRGADVPLFVHHLFYLLFTRNIGLPAAFERAQEIVFENHMFRVFGSFVAA